MGQKRLKFYLTTHHFSDGKTDNTFFEFKDLGQIPIRTLSTVADCKKVLLQTVTKLEGYDWVTADSMRLREKTADKLTTLFRDSSVMEKYTMFDGKEIGIQVSQNSKET